MSTSTRAEGVRMSPCFKSRSKPFQTTSSGSEGVSPVLLEDESRRLKYNTEHAGGG